MGNQNDLSHDESGQSGILDSIHWSQLLGWQASSIESTDCSYDSKWKDAEEGEKGSVSFMHILCNKQARLPACGERLGGWKREQEKNMVKQ